MNSDVHMHMYKVCVLPSLARKPDHAIKSYLGHLYVTGESSGRTYISYEDALDAGVPVAALPNHMSYLKGLS